MPNQSVIPAQAGVYTVIPAQAGVYTVIPAQAGVYTVIPAQAGVYTVIPAQAGIHVKKRATQRVAQYIVDAVLQRHDEVQPCP